MSVLRSMRPCLLVAAALAAPIPALAQEVTEAPESVVVSTSRISLKGYEAPTPVTEIGLEKIERDAKMDIGDLIREMPATGAFAVAEQWRQRHRCQPGRRRAGYGQPAQPGHRAHPGAVRRPARGVVEPLGGGVDLTTLPADPDQARRCGDRRRLGGLGLRCRGRRGQSGPGQGLRGRQGQCRIWRQRDRSQPAQDGAGRRLGHRFRRRPRSSGAERQLHRQPRSGLHRTRRTGGKARPWSRIPPTPSAAASRSSFTRITSATSRSPRAA